MSIKEGPYSVRSNEGGVWAVTVPGTADLTVYKDHAYLLCGRLNEAYNAGRASQEPEGRALPADPDVTCMLNLQTPDERTQQEECRQCLGGPTRQDYAKVCMYAEQAMKWAGNLSHVTSLVTLRDAIAELRKIEKANVSPPAAVVS